MYDNFLTQTSDPPSSDHTHLSDFKYILANQHSKEFHLLDSPDLIFELSQYKFNSQKSNNNKNQPSPPFNKKIYRHKSQEESIDSSNLDKHSNPLPKNTPIIFNKFKPTRASLDQTTNPQFEPKMHRKMQGTKQKSYTNKQKSKPNSLKIDFKNLTEKQNLQTKILSVSRHHTSKIAPDLKNIPLNQAEVKSNWKRGFQRKKYSELKTKLQHMIKTVQNCEQLNFSEVFEYEQAILKQYLESLVCELKKECIEKGQLIEIIWNTFFALINKIMKMMIEKTKLSQKNQVQAELNLHEGYQEMYVYEANKIIELGKKYNESKNVIDRLIYELRFKRKESKKLYKSLAICNEKLNEYKVEHIDLQNEHIDLLIEARQMDRDEAVQILKRKLQVNREKYMKLRVGMNKEQMKEKIEREIESELLDPEEEQIFKKQLFEKINAFKLKKKMTSAEEKEQSHFVEQFIERYSSKFIPPQEEEKEVQVTKTIRKPKNITVAVNTDADPKFKPELKYSVTQTTFSDKLQYCLINHLSTQTPGFQRLKKSNNVEIQADGDQMKIVLTKARMMAYRTMDLSFYFDVRKNQRIKPLLSNKMSQTTKKPTQNNNSISEIDSDDNDSIPTINSKKRLSKNQLSQKRQQKVSIFNNSMPNYSNLKSSSSKGKDLKAKFHKKRASDMPDSFQTGFQESEFKRQRSRPKKTFQVNEFSQSPKRQSICSSNVESLVESFTISEEKERYIEKFIMNKDQEFEIVEQNSIFDAFRSLIDEREQSYSHHYHEAKLEKKLNESRGSQSKRSSHQSEDEVEILNPKLIKTVSEIVKQNPREFQQNGVKKHSIFKPNTNSIPNRNSGFIPHPIKEKQLLSEKKEEEKPKMAYFLQMVIELTVKKSMVKKKLDQSNFHAIKQKCEFTSITQKLDPFMLDVECLMNQACTKKKKPSSINIKAANKLLMMTYSRSIDQISRNNAILQNLIRPLFECFEVMYGAMKPNDIYRKMVAFISDLMSVRECENFKEFIFFLGMDKTNINSAHLTTFDVCLFLKLLQKLNLGNKICAESQSVFTSKRKVNMDLVSVLEEENISPQVIFGVSGKIKTLLQKLEDFVREKMPLTDEESKINLFKVSKMIVEEIIKIRAQSMRKLEMYMSGSDKIPETNENVQKAKNDMINVSKMMEIVECCRISTSKKLYFAKYIEELCAKECAKQGAKHGQKIIKRSELGVLLIRVGLVNFEDLEERIRYVEERDLRLMSEQKMMGDFKMEGERKEVNYSNFGRNLEKLSRVEVETNILLENMLGSLMISYEIGLIKNLEGRKENKESKGEVRAK